MSFSIRLAFRYLATRKLRTLLTMVAIVLGVMLLFGMNNLLPTMKQTFRQNILATVGKVDLTLTGLLGASFPQQTLDQVRQVDGIASATALLQRNAILPQPAASATGLSKPGLSTASSSVLTVTGVLPDSFLSVRPPQLSSGRFLNGSDTGAIVISEDLAKQMNLALGGQLTLPSTQGKATFEIVGLVSSGGIPGSNEEVFIPLSQAQSLFNLPGEINTIQAMYRAGADGQKVQDGVKALLGSSIQIGQNELGTDILGTLEIGEVALNLFGSLALLMGGFIIFNTFRTLVAERKRDIGLLRAVGASRRFILGLILTESLVQGVIGTALGLLAGWGLTVTVMAFLSGMFAQTLRLRVGEVVYPLNSLLLSIVLGVGVSVLGGLLPAISATRITPLEALRPVVPSLSTVARRNLVPGLVMIGLALVGLLSGDFNLAALGMMLFLVGLVWAAPGMIQPLAKVFQRLTLLVFAREGTIATGNLARQPGRSAITASSIMISLAVSLAMISMVNSISTGFISYIDRNLGSDFVIMPQSMMLSAGNIGASPDLLQKIRDLPGISAAASMRIGRASTGSVDLQMIGIDPAEYVKVAGLVFQSGDEKTAYAAMAAGRAIIVNGIFAGKSQLEVGSSLLLQTPTGEHTYQVVGIGLDYLNAKISTAYISQVNLEQDFKETSDLLLLANGSPTANRVDVRVAVKTLLDNYPSFSLFSASEWKNSQMGLFGSAMYLLYFMVFVLAAPSLLALINTLAINVLERTHEIGLMRAVGATRRQVQRMILAESLLLSGFGTAMGILVGLWMGYILTGSLKIVGFILPYEFPAAGILVIVAVGLLFGVVAAWLPARQAARLQVVDALHYE